MSNICILQMYNFVQTQHLPSSTLLYFSRYYSGWFCIRFYRLWERKKHCQLEIRPNLDRTLTL